MVELKSITDWIMTNRKHLQRLLIMKRSIKLTLLWVNFVIGSFIHDFIPIPQSYFSNTRNFFNVYFVKNGWGWTMVLLFAYISTLLIKQKIMQSITIYKHLSRLLVTTIIWYSFTTSFDVIENWTGTCLGNNLLYTKTQCRNSDMIWDGFDISGHVFLLTFCIMIINEELSCADVVVSSCNGESSDHVSQRKDERNILGIMIKEEFFDQLIEFLSLLLILLMILWEVMLLFTCLYFHSLSQKLLGFLFSSFSFCVSYQFIFKHKHPYTPCSPSMIAELHRN